MNKKEIDIFYCLKEIITIKSGNLHTHPQFKQTFNVWLICRYLSMDERFRYVADLMNYQGQYLSQEQMYKWLVKIVPQYKNSFIKYISKPKKPKEKLED